MVYAANNQVINKVFEDNRGKMFFLTDFSDVVALGADQASIISYLYLAEFITRHCANPQKDLEQLWIGRVFKICIQY